MTTDAVDQLSVLSHRSIPLAKKWLADGTIEQYALAKYFTLSRQKVRNVRELSDLLSALEEQVNSCIIRGRYVGDERAKAVDDKFKAGSVRRTLDCFEDQPLHTLLVEVDNFVPVLVDPNTDPDAAIHEYIHACLPAVFHGAAHHWQLSNSAGHAKNEGKLKAHLWFWLSTPYTSGQLRAWAEATNVELDKATMNPVQVHYTARPLFAEGQVDPLKRRSGFTAGNTASVPLVLSEEVLHTANLGRTRTSRSERLKLAAHNDPTARRLYELGHVKSVGDGGELRIECPRIDLHTGASGETATLYYPANTGGYAQGHFHCLHAHCTGVADSQFLIAIGYDPVEELFDDVSGNDSEAPIVLRTESTVPTEQEQKDTKARAEITAEREAVKRGDIPKAQNLCTDQANLNRLMKAFGSKTIAVGDTWYVWTGRHWSSDKTTLYSWSLRLSSIVHVEAETYDAKAQALPPDQEAKRKLFKGIADALRVWCKRCEMKGTLEAAVSLLKQMVQFDPRRLDSNPHLLNCASGTIDLRTMTLYRPKASDYITRYIDVEYKSNADYSLFEKVVQQAMLEDVSAFADLAGPLPEEVPGPATRRQGRAGGSLDPRDGYTPRTRFLQRWFGLCLTGDMSEQVMVFHYGSGRNGKSTILDTIAAVMGEYASPGAPGLLIASRNERHPTEIAALRGRRMLTSHETEQGQYLAESRVKQFTGGDELAGRGMGENFTYFKSQAKLNMLTNHPPSIRGSDEGIWRRILLVDYRAKFGTVGDLAAGVATHLRDFTMIERLKTPAALEGVLRWLIEGAAQWYARGLDAPESVKVATAAYRSDQDKMQEFIADRCVLGPNLSTTLSGEDDSLFPTYTRWCEDSNYSPLGKRRFLDELERVLPGCRGGTHRSGGRDARKKLVKIYGVAIQNDI